MKANLFLYPESFKYNGIDTEQEVCSKLRSFVKDISIVISDNKAENTFISTYALFSCPVFNQIGLADFATSHLPREENEILFLMIANVSGQNDKTYEELVALTYYEKHETEVNAIVYFNFAERDHCAQTIQFDKYQIVYGRRSWITLRRQILGNHPGTPKYFISECRKYFDNIFFHNNCETSIASDNYLEYIPRKIIRYLSCINDCLDDVIRDHKIASHASDGNSILEDLSGRYGLDRAGSLQRKPSNKRNLTFAFPDSSNGATQVYCEQHLKITSPDEGIKISSSNKLQARIYFSFKKEGIANGRYLVCSIGPHI